MVPGMDENAAANCSQRLKAAQQQGWQFVGGATDVLIFKK
jgi:hypothetical protein